MAVTAGAIATLAGGAAHAATRATAATTATDLSAFSQAGPGRQSAPRPHQVTPARTAQSHLFYDSVTPSAIPANQMVATYANGSYAIPPAQVAGRGKVLWIDVTGFDYAAAVLDVEPGDATPSQAADWARHKLSANPNGLARIYTMQSEWPAVQAAVATLPPQMRSHVRYWIADPTGYPHLVPGSDATQWYWGQGYDISTATPRF